MNLSASVYHYQEYLKPLVKWKILDTNSLQSLTKYKGSYVSFCKMMKNLQDHNLICWETIIHRRKRVIYLTREAQKAILPNDPYFIDDRIIFHDAIVSNIVRSLLGKKYFHDCELPHEYIGKNNWNYANILEPDAILFGNNKGLSFKIAIEVELTQKSKDRITEKINTYIKSEFFDSVIYIFDKRNIFDSYINLVKEIQENSPSLVFKKGIGQKIFFLFKEDLLKFPLDFSENPLFVNGKLRKFREVLDG
jgi:hypothetical protein